MSSYEPYGGQYPGQYPPPPPQPYAGYPPPPPSAPRNGLGVTALVLAVLGLLFSWTVAGGIVLGLVALIIGFAARGRVKRGEATNGSLAISGIVLGALAIVLGLVFIPVWISFFSQLGIGDYVDCMTKAGNDRTAQVQCESTMRGKIESDYGVTIAPTP
ncbi:MAG: DUF4190 domain-containing protein [Mycolicibacterium cosmeticum]|nr:DUF4190 domain-containing protein [Mycolicibacterium cosmeticum]